MGFLIWNFLNQLSISDTGLIKLDEDVLEIDQLVKSGEVKTIEHVQIIKLADPKFKSLHIIIFTKQSFRSM